MSDHAIITVNPDFKIEQLVKAIINHPQKQLILEVPEKTTFLTNEINLRLIKFYAEDEGKELIINGVDPVLVSMAQRLGISTIRERNLDVTSRQEAAAAAISQPTPEEISVEQPQPQRHRKKKQHWTSRSFWPAVSVTLFTLVVGIWYFLQPKALIIVYPKEQKINFGAKARVSPAYQDQQILDGRIPAKVLEKQGEVTVQTVTSGKKVIGVTPATGKVILINRSNQPVVVPQGSIVIGSQGVRFGTAKNVLVPKKTTRMRYGIPVGEEYGKVEVAVTALEKGTVGNQPAKAISKIEAKYQQFLQVVNLEPTTGGTDQNIAVVSAADIEKGQTEATNQMHLTAPDELAALAGTGYVYLPELVRLRVLQLNSTPEVGAEAATVKTYLKYRVSAIAPATAGIQKYLLNQLDANIPPGFKTKSNQVKLVSVQVLNAATETAELQLIATATLRGILSQSKLKELVKGKSITAAKQILTGQNEVADFRIETSNPKRRYLPRFSFQIKVLFPAEKKSQVQ